MDNALVNEIREFFAAKIPGRCLLENVLRAYPAYGYMDAGEFGVAVPYDGKKIIAEHFANAQLHSRTVMDSDSRPLPLLTLTCSDDAYRMEFAVLCAQFLDPGQSGENRKELLADPLRWWTNWKNLLGNSVTEKKAYSVIAEMMTLYQLYKKNPEVRWAAVDHGGSQDVETSDTDYEVKSTLDKSDTTITVSSQWQLKRNSERRLMLYFFRMEKSQNGESVNDMAEKLKQAGYDAPLLESELMKIGFEQGTSARNEKYKILEERKYPVDEDFPRITAESFVDGKIPERVIKFSYTIDLEGLRYTK